MGNTTSTTPFPNDSTEEHAGLFYLPGEVRNQIYSHVLLFPSPIAIYRTKDPLHQTPRPENNEPSLFATIVPLFLLSKPISLEATTYFYSRNTFTVPDASVWPLHWERLPVMTRCFLDPIGPANARCLRHLCIRFPLYNGRYTDWYQPAIEEQRPLLPGISSRCRGLTTLEFEARSSGQFRAQLSCCDWETQKRVLTTLAEALRGEFAGLTGLVMNLYEDACYLPVEIQEGGGREGFVREIGRCGWTVRLLEKRPVSIVWTAEGEMPAAPGERRVEEEQKGAWRRGKERVLRRLRI